MEKKKFEIGAERDIIAEYLADVVAERDRLLQQLEEQKRPLISFSFVERIWNDLMSAIRAIWEAQKDSEVWHGFWGIIIFCSFCIFMWAFVYAFLKYYGSI